MTPEKPAPMKGEPWGPEMSGGLKFNGPRIGDLGCNLRIGDIKIIGVVP